MKCSKCGAENAEDAVFCNKCGHSFQEQKKEERSQSMVGKVKEKMTDAINHVKNSPKVVILGVMIIAVLLLSGVSYISNRKTTINLNNYLEAEYSGYDGYGKVIAKINWDKLEDDYDMNKLYIGMKDHPITLLSYNITPEFNQNAGLDNGESIECHWNVNTAEIKRYFPKCKFIFTDVSFEVEGLSTVELFNPFEDVELTFSGISPGVHVELAYHGTEFEENDFEVKTDRIFKNGDTIQISLNANIDSYVNKTGRLPQPLVMEYIVDGVPEYAEDFAELSEEFQKGLKKEAIDILYDAYRTATKPGNEIIQNLEYVGYVSNSLKLKSTQEDNTNYLYLIFTGDEVYWKNTSSTYDIKKMYYAVEFQNVVIGKEAYSYDRNFSYYDYGIDSYSNPKVCFEELVDNKIEKYKVWFGDGFEKYDYEKPITCLNDISEGYLEQLHQYADEKARDWADSWCKMYFHDLIEIHNLGDYFLIAKDQTCTRDEKNNLLVAYTYTYKGRSPSMREPTYYKTEYIVVGFKGIEIVAENEYVYNDVIDVYRVYSSAESLFADEIFRLRNRYSYEMTEELKQYGE